MTDRQVLGVAILAGAVLLLRKPSTLALVTTPAPAAALDRVTPDRLSTVTPSYATGTQATNPNNLLANASTLLNKLVNSLTDAVVANKPIDTAAAFNGDEPANRGLAPASSPGVASVGSRSLIPDPSLADGEPYFGWGIY